MLYEQHKFNIDYEGSTIIHSIGTDPKSKLVVDESVRIIINLFEEVKNRKNQTL